MKINIIYKKLHVKCGHFCFLKIFNSVYESDVFYLFQIESVDKINSLEKLSIKSMQNDNLTMNHLALKS